MSVNNKSDLTIAVMPSGRVVRYKVDQVGNDLTATLRWCETHSEPVWVYSDGSFTCPHDLIVEVHNDNHTLTDAPWERA